MNGERKREKNYLRKKYRIGSIVSKELNSVLSQPVSKSLEYLEEKRSERGRILWRSSTASLDCKHFEPVNDFSGPRKKVE